MDCDHPIIDIDAHNDGTFAVNGKWGLTARQAADAVYDFLKDYKVKVYTYDGPPSPLDIGQRSKEMMDRMILDILTNDPFVKLLDQSK